jgi:hypothetical protein
VAARYNIAPDPLDGFVDITDISRMTALFGQGCPPQVFSRRSELD